MHDMSDTFRRVIGLYLGCLLFAAILYYATRLAEEKAYKAGEYSGAFHEYIRREDEKVEEKSNG